MYLGVAEEVDLCARTISMQDWIPHLNFPRLHACLSYLKQNSLLSGLLLYIEFLLQPSTKFRSPQLLLTLETSLSTLNLSGKLIILGDLNSHVDNSNDAEANQFLDL